MKGLEGNSQVELLIEEHAEDSQNSWLMTFSDICLLLLAFFVLLFSMSSFDMQRFTHSFYSVKRALGSQRDGNMGLKAKTFESDGVFMKKAQLLKQIRESQSQVFADFNFHYADQGREGLIGARFNSGKITLAVSGNVLFPSGEVELSAKGIRVLEKIRDFVILHPDQKINIKGHSDDVPPSPDSRFEDNWEISSLRAISVLKYLLEEGIEPNRLSATGLADLEPVVPNSSEENRSRNRRVEFVLTKRLQGS